MKTFSATDARNKFGEFLDSGMVEGVKVVRNNRVLGYFIPQREYEELRRSAMATEPTLPSAGAGLSQAQKETLCLYSEGKISSTEAKVDLGCDRRGLIALVAQSGLSLPHMDRAQAETAAREALEAIGLTITDSLQPRGHAADGSASRG